MGNKKADSYKSQSDAAYASSNAEIQKIQPSAESSAIAKGAYGDYQNLRNGDVSKNPLVANYLARAGAGRRKADTVTPMGDASLATRIANPTLLAQNKDMLNRQGQQEDAENVTNLAAQAEMNAVNRVNGFSDVTMNAAGARASAYRGLSSDAFSRYQTMKQQGGFWSNLAKGALTTAAGAFAGPLGGMAGKAVGNSIFGNGN